MSLLGILMRERERDGFKNTCTLLQFNTIYKLGHGFVTHEKCTGQCPFLYKIYSYTLFCEVGSCGDTCMHVLSNTFARTGVFRVRRSPAPELLNLAKTTIKRQLKDYFNRN